MRGQQRLARPPEQEGGKSEREGRRRASSSGPIRPVRRGGVQSSVRLLLCYSSSQKTSRDRNLPDANALGINRRRPTCAFHSLLHKARGVASSSSIRRLLSFSPNDISAAVRSTLVDHTRGSFGSRRRELVDKVRSWGSDCQQQAREHPRRRGFSFSKGSDDGQR